MIIDVHTHIVPEHFPPVGTRPAGNLWPSMDHQPDDGSGFQKANVMIAGRNFRTALDRCWSVPRRITEVAEQGIDRQVLSPMPELLAYHLDPDDGLDLSRHLNETIARMMDEAPDRFYGLGAVPLQDVEMASRELTRVKELGLQGVEITSNINGKSPGDPQFKPFFQEVEAQGVAVFVHAQHPTFMERVVGPRMLENAVGFPLEGAIAAASIVTSGLLDDFPKLRICMSHGGGTFAQLLPRIQNAWNGGAGLKEAMQRSPTEMAQMLFYDDIFFNNTTLRYLMDIMGTSQVMVGSDYPFMFRKQSPEDEFTELGLSDAERSAVSSANCLRFLGLEA